MTSAANQLIPELQRYCDQIGEIEREVERLTGGLTDAQMQWSPAPDRWSLVQLFDHLNRVGGPLLPKMQEAIRQGKAQGWHSEGPFRYNWMERLFIRMLSPGATMKVPVPPLFVPAESPVPESLPKFMALQEALRACIGEANGLNLTRMKITSPASRLVRLCLGAWFAATVAHEQYHLLQMQALRADPQFPS
jgi:hypothetical protein